MSIDEALEALKKLEEHNKEKANETK